MRSSMAAWECVKREMLDENELQNFCSSLATTLTSKFEFTLDYFDPSIGILHSKESPTLANFCVALLKEILCNLKPNHDMWDKIKYAAFLLNLATRDIEFSILYEVYHQVELEVSAKNLSWKDVEVRRCLDEKIAEKLIVKDDVCSLPDLDFDSKNDVDLHFDSLGLLKRSGDGEEEVEEDPLARLDTNQQEENEDTQNMTNGRSRTKRIKKDGAHQQSVLNPPTKRRKNRAKRKIKTEVQKEVKKLHVKKREPVFDDVQYDDYDGDNILDSIDNNDEGTGVKTRVACLLCNHKARDQQELERHAFEKHKANRLCIQCGHLSSTYKDFVSHNETHLFTCEVCQKKVLGSRKLRAHMKLHETKQEAGQEVKKVPCDVCGILLQEVSLKSHVTTVHSNEIHKCDMCDFTSNTKAKVSVHRKRHFVKQSKCPECGKTVKCLQKHFQRVCGQNNKVRHYCNLCEKSFTMKQGLDRHIRHIHQKITDYHCQLCDYKTYTNFNLKLHISKMHTKEDMERECPFCNQKTNSLDYHIKIYHMDDKIKKQLSNGEGEDLDHSEQSISDTT